MIVNAIKIAKEFDFFSSQGSDFHEPTAYGVKLGTLLDMPKALNPVWKHPAINKYLTK